jgi:hypothetical protein
MTHPTYTLAVSDPREFDGNPYEVAEQATRQLHGLARLMELSLPAVEKMARNAQMERDIALGGEPDAAGWPDSPQGRQFEMIRRQNADHVRVLNYLVQAAAYDPKNPPTA